MLSPTGCQARRCSGTNISFVLFESGVEFGALFDLNAAASTYTSCGLQDPPDFLLLVQNNADNVEAITALPSCLYSGKAQFSICELGCVGRNIADRETPFRYWNPETRTPDMAPQSR